MTDKSSNNTANTILAIDSVSSNEFIEITGSGVAAAQDYFTPLKAEAAETQSILQTLGKVIASAFAVVTHDLGGKVLRFFARRDINLLDVLGVVVIAAVYTPKTLLGFGLGFGAMFVWFRISRFIERLVFGSLASGGSATVLGGSGNTAIAGKGKRGGSAISIGGSGNVAIGGDSQ